MAKWKSKSWKQKWKSEKWKRNPYVAPLGFRSTIYRNFDSVRMELKIKGYPLNDPKLRHKDWNHTLSLEWLLFLFFLFFSLTR